MSARLPDNGSDPMARRIKAITNVFEVGAAEPNYSYIEALGDGRGFTITQYGLVTNELEVGAVIARHLDVSPTSPLSKYLPSLPPHEAGTDTAKLSGLVADWPVAIRDYASLTEACDHVADQLYFTPAVGYARAMRITLPAGLSIFFDTILQHGDGHDEDSFGAILRRTCSKSDWPNDSSETHFLMQFLEQRRDVLQNPANKETTDVWRNSVGRVAALELLLQRNPQLSAPVIVTNFETRVVLS